MTHLSHSVCVCVRCGGGVWLGVEDILECVYACGRVFVCV